MKHPTVEKRTKKQGVSLIRTTTLMILCREDRSTRIHVLVDRPLNLNLEILAKCG